MPVIPDARWGSSSGPLGRVGTRVAGTRPGSWLVRRLVPLDRRLLLRTRGRRTVLGPVGMPMLVLETTGRRSGQPRHSPLLFARDADPAAHPEAVVVVGSNFGGERHPAWTSNLLADPRARVLAGGVEVDVTATLLTGAEADAAYARMVEVTAVYDAYRTRTDRDIRVFRLTPVDPT